jgi:SAM-dependent methyltransferase
VEQGVYRLFSEIQSTHWWFVARRIIIEDLLRRYLPDHPQRIAEIGCGTGIMLGMLHRFGEAWGIDNSPEAVRLCKEQGFGHVYHIDDPEWRKVEFDGMAFFDVIEHVPDDAGFLKSALGHLKPDGWVIITVPAFMFLWSEHDELNRHYRRYTARQLRATITASGMVLARISYFNTWLFPPILLARILVRTKRKLLSAIGLDGRGSLRTDFERNIAFLNSPLKHIFASERFLLRCDSFPFGTSILALARKPAMKIAGESR